jgi:DNA helicase-2/ATP-dependent DNA helicase PcrA
MNLRTIVSLVISESGLLEHYRAEREGADRVENLEELVNAAESFVMQEGFGRDAAALDSVLTQSPASQGLMSEAAQGQTTDADDKVAFPEGTGVGAGADPIGDTGETLSPLAAFLSHAALEAGDNMAQAGQDAIQLMTVHSAKGLEFDCVFITGMEEGLFPHENSLSDREGLEEERRLMYVAITRARHRLYLSHSQTRMLHGQTRYNLKSRFFDELPEACLKWLTPPRVAAPAFNSFRSSPSSWEAPYRDDTPRHAPVARKDDTNHGLRVQQKVFHAKFGEGTVLTLEGTADDARAQVSFARHGTKWLALSVAKLIPVP